MPNKDLKFKIKDLEEIKEECELIIDNIDLKIEDKRESIDKLELINELLCKYKEQLELYNIF